MKQAPEKYRVTNKRLPLHSDASYGNNGMFAIPHYNVADYEIYCMISDGSVKEEDQKWEHVSVTVAHKKKQASRCPTWQEMCFVKDMFWNTDETVIQYHPPEEEYVNNHAFCLHLWKPVGIELPLPDSLMVGLKNIPPL